MAGGSGGFTRVTMPHYAGKVLRGRGGEGTVGGGGVEAGGKK